MKYKAVLFDFDYTLANSEAGILMCFKYVLDEHGFKEVTEDAIKRTIGMTLEDAFECLTGIEDIDTLMQYKKEYVAKADKEMTKNTKLYEATIPALNRLREQGIKIGVISTKLSYRIQATFDEYNISDWISIIIGGADVKENKPSPEGLLFAIDKLNLQKEEILYVGDSIIDAKTAQNAEVDFIGVTTGTTTKEELEVYPTIKVIEDLAYL